MIYQINKNTVIDANGYRTLKNSIPTNNDSQSLCSINESEMDSAMIYVSMLKKHKNINHTISSYGLKHRAEEYLRNALKREENNYISNGAMIVALIESGFDYKTDKYYFAQMHTESLNLCFNISRKSINELKK